MLFSQHGEHLRSRGCALSRWCDARMIGIVSKSDVECDGSPTREHGISPGEVTRAEAGTEARESPPNPGGSPLAASGIDYLSPAEHEKRHLALVS